MLAGTRHDLDEAPALRRRQRPRLLDEDGVADVRVVRLVMGLELGRQADDALVQPVAGQALDGHDDRLVHLVADHAPDLRLALCLLHGVAPCHRTVLVTHVRAAWVRRSRWTVRIRAIVRRVWGIVL